MAAKAFGADSVAITDLKNDNLVLAEQLGADICLNPKASATPAEVGEWLKASLPPYGPDVVIDCAGFESTLQVGCLSVESAKASLMRLLMSSEYAAEVLAALTMLP